MMLKETYVALLKKKMIEFPDARFYIVMRFLPEWVELNDQVVHCPILSPSIELFSDYKYNGLSWDQYAPIFLKEMESAEAQEAMKTIVKESRDHIVFLVCVEKTDKFCHRFLLLELMKKLDS